MPSVYKIHPAIGIAQIGNSTASWFDGPEVPDIDFAPPPNGLYRDAGHKIRRQAVRFRIYEYSYHDHALTQLAAVREITNKEAEIS